MTLQRRTKKPTIFHNGLTLARAEKPKCFLAEKPNKCDWRIAESLKKNIVYEGRAFYRLNQRILPKRTGDIVFSELVVTLQKTFHNGLTPARAEKPKLFLAEKSNKCDRRITESLKKNLVYEGRAFYHLNQGILPKRTRDIVFSVLCKFILLTTANDM